MLTITNLDISYAINQACQFMYTASHFVTLKHVTLTHGLSLIKSNYLNLLL